MIMKNLLKECLLARKCERTVIIFVTDRQAIPAVG